MTCYHNLQYRYQNIVEIIFFVHIFYNIFIMAMAMFEYLFSLINRVEIYVICWHYNNDFAHTQ